MQIRWEWILLVASMMLSGCSRLDVVQREYLDGASLRADGVIAKGWISESFPNGSRNIKLATNLDTNSVWMQFKVRQQEVDEIARACSKAELRAEDVPAVGIGRWWPDDLTKDRFKPSRFTAYRCGDGGFFAVDTPASPAYFWRHHN